ncbi:MAG: fibronectin type III domain-containing protein [Bacteroidota bacterium]
MINFKTRVLLSLLISSVAIFSCKENLTEPEEGNIWPPAPTNLFVVQNGPRSVTLRWTPSISPDSIINYWLSINGKNPIALAKTARSYESYTFNIDSLQTFSLRAKGINGNMGPAATIQWSRELSAPAPPTYLKANSRDHQAVALQWVESLAADLTNFAGYELIVQATGSTPTPPVFIPKPATSFVVNGLQEGVVYTFTLKSKKNTAKDNISIGDSVRWSPARRFTNVKLFETDSPLGSGVNLSNGEVLKITDASKWDIALNTKSNGSYQTYIIGSPSFLNYGIANPRITRIAQRVIDKPISIDAVFDTFSLGDYAEFKPDSIGGVIFYTNTGSNLTNNFLFFAKTQEGNYAKIFVKAVNGTILQGVAPNRFIELDISYQGTANLPYALVHRKRGANHFGNIRQTF